MSFSTHGPGYVVLDLSQIRRGNDGIAPGWSMGAFFPPDDPRHSTSFEIKEWDSGMVQPRWRNHPNVQKEYIAVLAGTLIVFIGAVQGDSSVIQTVEQIIISPGQRIVLRAGTWRRYEATHDASGISIRNIPLDR